MPPKPSYEELQSRVEELELYAQRCKETLDSLPMPMADYHAIFNAANDAIFILDPKDGRILDVNRKMMEMYGYTKEGALQQTMESLSEGNPPYSRAEAEKNIEKTARGEHHLIEWRARKKNGDLFWVEVNLKIVALDGEDRMIAIVRDIGARKRAEEALKEREFELSEAQRVGRIGNFRWKLYSEFIEYSDELMRMWWEEPGKGALRFREEALERVHPEDREKVMAAIGHAVETGDMYSAVFRIVSPDGEQRIVHGRGYVEYDPDGKPVILRGTGQDITELKQTEQALRFTQYAVDKTIDQAFWMTADGSLFYVNDAACRALGYSREELLKLSIPDIDPNFSYEKFARHWQALKKSGSATFESFHRAKDGRVYPVEIRSNHVVFDGKEYHCAFVTDITERKRMEQSLRESEGFRRALLQTVPDLIWLKDPNGVYLACNAMFERFFGAREEDIVGKTDYDFVEKALADFFREHDCKAIAAGKPSNNEEWITFADDGRRALLDTIKTPMFDDQGNLIGVLGVGRDITERKNAEEEQDKLRNQLQQAQKMESIGRLAGGVAHDFNNLLGVILGYGELAMLQTDPAGELHGALQEIMKAARRSADVTRQLLAFARKQTISPKVIDLNETIGTMLKMVNRLIGEDIQLAWLPEKDLPPVKMDPSQIDQILVNLCVNSRDAISGVGKLTIETGMASFDEDYCRDHQGFVPGDFVLLSVSDDGSGMDKSTLQNIFEPFFTTKGVDRGTGLGLATVYGIVKQNDGFINVYSEPGIGTTFKIYFPRHASGEEPILEKKGASRDIRASETILVVEDDPTLLGMALKMLESMGYSVLSASTPQQAIDVAKTHSGEIHLLITDIIMPEMNGRDLAQNLAAHYPGLKCLFMSGYTSNVIAHHGVLDEGVNFMQKPFSMKDLSTKVRDSLDKLDAIDGDL